LRYAQRRADFLKNSKVHGRLDAHMPNGIPPVGPPGTGVAPPIDGRRSSSAVLQHHGSEFVELFVGFSARYGASHRRRHARTRRRSVCPCHRAPHRCALLDQGAAKLLAQETLTEAELLPLAEASRLGTAPP
jgi:hypothetical protein